MSNHRICNPVLIVGTCLLVTVMLFYKDYAVPPDAALLGDSKYGLQLRNKERKADWSRLQQDYTVPVLNNSLNVGKNAESISGGSENRDLPVFNKRDDALILGRLLGQTRSPFAYVTLIHGIDNSYRYRGFLYAALIMRKSLQTLGSTADFICMIGYATTGDSLDHKNFADDLHILEKAGIRLFYLPRLLPDKRKVTFGEMALLKIIPFSFLEYRRIQYFDGDILPMKNMDCYFKLEVTTFNTGNASPLNSGWFLALPNSTLFEKMRKNAIRRLSNRWNETLGWGQELPPGVFLRGSKKEVKKWDFNGASLDQGLLLYTFVLNEGNVMMLDVSDAERYGCGFVAKKLNLRREMRCCNNKLPVECFAHFTGQKKPWLQNLRKTRDSALILWRDSLDNLQLPLNSSNFHELSNMKPPLGYFYPNK